jgi:sugar phosphate isomerase/epimerase
MQRDPAGTIAAVAAAGFEEVEFAGFYGRTAGEMRELIDRNSLTSPAGHVSIDDLRARLPQLLVDADVLGWRWLIVPWIDQRERTAAGYHAIAADLNRAGKIAAGNGVRIGFHAEDYDFRPLADGTIPYDILLRESDPSVVDMELDTYWIAKGGGDPLRYLSQYPGRFPLLHIKDITADGKMANAGDGIIDFPTIVAAARKAGAAHFIIENDEPRDPMADVSAGLRYLKQIIR